MFSLFADRARLYNLLGSDEVLVSKKDIKKTQITDTEKQLKPSRKLMTAFEEDYPTFLLSLASSVRTGLDPIDGIKVVNQMLSEKSVLRIELESLLKKLESGFPEEEAIFSFGKSIQHPDISLFTTALILSRREGSSLGACLQRLTKVTRQRQSFRRKAKSAVAMQRLSSFGIAGCSALIGFGQIFMNPQGFNQAWHHPMGFSLLLTGLGLLLGGLVWMLYIARSRV